MDALRSVETSGTMRPATQCHIPNDVFAHVNNPRYV